MLPTLIHALRTPISGLAMGIEVAAMRLRRHDDDTGFLGPMRRTLQEMSETLQQLECYVRFESGEEIVVDAAGYFENAVQSWQAKKPQAPIVWERGADAPTAQRLALDVDAVAQSVGHLLDNALEAGGEAPILLSLKQTAPASVCLSVCNSGGPIDDDVLARMTEPFFTTKHRHLGLGLAFAEHIARAHRGQITIDTGAAGIVVGLHLSDRRAATLGAQKNPPDDVD
ncbi:hypothetical protein Q3G72_032916 [Acer saccharum]|nr:hypothetical protein Q3G72_032916 [Acer saccharum]